MGNSNGNATPEPGGVLEQVDNGLIVGAQVQVWWPNDERSYSGIISSQTRGRPGIVSVLYRDGETKRYHRDTVFLTRLAIGKVMKISLILRSI